MSEQAWPEEIWYGERTGMRGGESAIWHEKPEIEGWDIRRYILAPEEGPRLDPPSSEIERIDRVWKLLHKHELFPYSASIRDIVPEDRIATDEELRRLKVADCEAEQKNQEFCRQVVEAATEFRVNYVDCKPVGLTEDERERLRLIACRIGEEFDVEFPPHTEAAADIRFLRSLADRKPSEEGRLRAALEEKVDRIFSGVCMCNFATSLEQQTAISVAEEMRDGVKAILQPPREEGP